MKKLSVLLFCFFSFFANGQKGTNSLGIGVKMRFPFSQSSYSAEYRDIGPNLQANWGVTKLGSVQAWLSHIFINLNGHDSTAGRSITFLQAGYRSYFLNSGFFVQADAGLLLWGRGKIKGSIVSSWIGGAGGGYSFKLSSTSFLDISPSANIMFNTGKYKLTNSLWIIGNVTYRFNLKGKGNRKN